MGTLHCALENGADLYVNECKRYDRHYRARSTEEEEEYQIPIFLLRALRNYSNVIHSFNCKSAIEPGVLKFKIKGAAAPQASLGLHGEHLL